MTEAYFQLVLPDGSIKLRKNRTIMEFKPSAYMALENTAGDGIYLTRDRRKPPRLQFPGGGINIGTETPLNAAIREAFEEIAVEVKGAAFIGQFETYEPVHLFKANNWWLPRGKFDLQAEEVSEVICVSYDEITDSYQRHLLSKQMYPAQMKMLGWYMLSRYRPDMFPVFKLWSEDPWVILDSLQ